MDYKNMKALVLAGGEPQIALINELKKRGYYVILVDYNETPVAKSYADFFYQESTMDIKTIREIIKKEKIDLIITVCTDQALTTMASLAEEFNLPTYIDSDTALKVTNKCLMKDIFQKNKIPTARFVIGSCEEIINESKKLKKPLIVKPADCNSSKGVVKVNKESELARAIENASTLSRTKKVIVEEFIHGRELSVDAVVENGKVIILAVSDIYKIKNEKKFIIYRAVCPANISEEVYQEIRKVGQCIADSFGLVNAPMLIQLIHNENGIKVIEFSARTGGGEKHHMLRQYCGVDIIKETVDMMLGQKTHIAPKEKKEFILNEFIYCSQGIYSHLEGIEELKKESLIKEYRLFKIPTDFVGGINSSGDRIAGYTICNTNYKDLDRINCQVIKRIKVVDNQGKDIIKRDISEHLIEQGRYELQ